MILSPLSSTSRVLKIGVSSKTLSQMDLTILAQVDDPPAADGDPRRRQRRDLGPARPAVPGARRPRPAARPRRHARQVVHAAPRRRRRSRRGGFIDTPNQRLAVRHLLADRRRPSDLARSRWSPSATARRSRLGDVADVVDRLPAADRRRRHQRRPRPAADRREAAVGQHARRDPRASRRRSRRCSPACTDVEIDSDDLPPGDVHRACRSHNLTDALLVGCVLVVVILVVVPVRLADGADQPDGDPAVAARRGARAALPRRRRINTMVLAGPGDRAGRGRRRRDHRRREHRPPAAAEPRRRQPAVGVPGRARRLARGPQRRRLRQPDRRPRVPAGLLPRRAGRLVLPPAGAGLRAGDPGVAARRADGHAGAVADAAAAARRAAAASRRSSRWLKARVPRDACRGSSRGRGWPSALLVVGVRRRRGVAVCRSGRGVPAQLSRKTTS